MFEAQPLVKFEDAVLRHYPTGSRYICNPPPTDTDNDTVILVNGYYDWQEALLNEGWAMGGSMENQGGVFWSYRKGEDNYIVTEDPDFFKSFILCTEAAKALNLLKKEDRITLFQTVRDHQYQEGYRGLDVQPQIKFDRDVFAMRNFDAQRIDGFVLDPEAD